MDLSCLSCKEPVNPDEAKIFSAVFLCPKCFHIAERLYRKGENELRMMLLVLRESIRIAALKGNLQFGLEMLDDMPKPDLIAHLAKLADEARKQAIPLEDTKWIHQDKIPSLENTKPLALPAGGKPPIS